MRCASSTELPAIDEQRASAPIHDEDALASINRSDLRKPSEINVQRVLPLRFAGTNGKELYDAFFEPFNASMASATRPDGSNTSSLTEA